MIAENYITNTCSIFNDTVHKNDLNAFENKGADLSAFLLSAYQHFQFHYPKFYKMDNLSKLGWLASEILLKDDFSKYNYQPEEIGVVLANSNSSLDNDLKYSDTLKDIPSPSVFVYTLPNIVIGEICIRNNFKGEHAFFIQESFNAGFIAQQVNYLLDNNILQACICGWVDVLEQHYKATLFLVEKKKEEKSLLFSAENMERIFNKA
ncbi:hypothetical protein KXD93_26155 [Mucilaginibacter sp. BJC16-A38]|uniref:hypothetical protein n=1 Tax=Mucilaginibacter phenanthrenivorans TaxID=1234842 RepID=UPI002156FA80|nr:hypothetical protein [Mucilaginibacter phenanthrenivorans]MCR8561169.1 hypothetical protein [Mucilaginibacter phenanthrenivorans]